jgi:hypothetical protein
MCAHSFKKIDFDGPGLYRAAGVKPEHFVFEMLRRCETKCGNAREIGVGGLCPPLRANRKAKAL